MAHHHFVFSIIVYQEVTALKLNAQKKTNKQNSF